MHQRVGPEIERLALRLLVHRVYVERKPAPFGSLHQDLHELRRELCGRSADRTKAVLDGDLHADGAERLDQVELGLDLRWCALFAETRVPVTVRWTEIGPRGEVPRARVA